MEKENSQENLKELLEKIKKDTGLDFTDKMDSIVLIDADDAENKTLKELIEEQEQGKVFGMTLDREPALKILKKLQGWTVGIHAPTKYPDPELEHTTIFASLDVDFSPWDAKLVFSFDGYMSYTFGSEEIEDISISYGLDEEGITKAMLTNATSVLAKHAELLREVYNYIVPPTDVCSAFVEEIVNVLEEHGFIVPLF